MFEVLSEASSNIDWGDTPDFFIIDVDEALLGACQKAVLCLKEAEMHYAVRWWAVSAEMYCEASDDDAIDKQLDGKSLVVFESDYRLDGEHLKVHIDGTVMLYCQLKDSSEEIWATVGNIDELLLRFDDVSGDKMAPAGVE